MEAPIRRALRTGLRRAVAEPADLARYRATLMGLTEASRIELGEAVMSWAMATPADDPQIDLKALGEALGPPPAGESGQFPRRPNEWPPGYL